MAKPKKIALIGYRLNKGGAERVMATLSNFFHKNGIEVHIIIVLDDIEYEYSGTVVNLGKLKNSSNGPFNKLKRLIFLKRYLSRNDFDFIIDFRFRRKNIQELIISKWVYNTKVIYTVHSSELYIYMPDFTPLTKLIYGSCHQIVSINNTMKTLIYEKHQLRNITTIYNPIDINLIEKKAAEKLELDFEYIISIGHFNTDQKQFDQLILAYSKSILPDMNIKLVLLGEGKKQEELFNVAKLNNVEGKVHMLGFKSNPFKYLKNSKYYAMTSLHEGLPMVLLESLACGTPVISYNCLTGPNEIIDHGNNGLLIEDQNLNAFVDGMNDMILNNPLYLRCKKNAKKSVDKFSIESIGKQWLNLMKI